MGGNLEDHNQFRVPLATFEELLTNLQSGKTAWDLEAFRKSLYDLAEVLRPHLQEEIETLRPEKLRPYIPADEFIQKEKESDEEILKKVSLTTSVPLLFVNGDGVNGAWCVDRSSFQVLDVSRPKAKDDDRFHRFPPLPPPLAFLVKYPLWLIHSDWWAFGSCDKHMRVKPQFAAYESSLEAKE